MSKELQEIKPSESGDIVKIYEDSDMGMRVVFNLTTQSSHVEILNDEGNWTLTIDKKMVERWINDGH